MNRVSITTVCGTMPSRYSNRFLPPLFQSMLTTEYNLFRNPALMQRSDQSAEERKCTAGAWTM